MFSDEGKAQAVVLLLKEGRGRQFQLEVIRSRLAAEEKSALLVGVAVRQF